MPISPLKQKEIPRKSVYRLSLYHRCLQKLRANDIETVSSEALAKAAGVKSTQLRKDIANFGQFGTRGLGYKVDTLITMLDEVLGTTRLQPVILVGVGNLGKALLHYGGFNKEGFEFVAAFDKDLAACTSDAENPVPVLPYDRLMEFILEHDVRLAILAVPAEAAQSVTNDLVQAGVQAVLNFSPTVLQTPDEVVVNNVDLALELENLSYFAR